MKVFWGGYDILTADVLLLDPPCFDFYDLISNACNILRKSQEVLATYRENFKHILVRFFLPIFIHIYKYEYRWL